MGLRTGHVGGILGPVRLVREWFRPMFPEIYAGVGPDRKARDERRHFNITTLRGKNLLKDGVRLLCLFVMSIIAMLSTYILLRVLFPYIVERIPLGFLGRY